MGTQRGKLPLESLARACTTYMGICVCVCETSIVFFVREYSSKWSLTHLGGGGGVSQCASSVVASQPWGGGRAQQHPES